VAAKKFVELNDCKENLSSIIHRMKLIRQGFMVQNNSRIQFEITVVTACNVAAVYQT
jgi:hypothetical protein